MEKAWKTRLRTQLGATPPRLLARWAFANLWMLWVGWPCLVQGSMSPLELTLSAVAAGILLWATRSIEGPLASARYMPPVAADRHGAGERPTWENLAALVVVPALLATLAALRPEALNAQALPAPLLLVAALSFSLYGAAVLHLDGARKRPPIGSSSPLTHLPYGTEPGRSQRIRRRLLVGSLTSGAIAIGLFAPHLGGYEKLAAAWGSQAEEGALLSAVVGGALGNAVVGVFLAEALRVRRPNLRPPRSRTLAVTSFLLLTVLGATIYLLRR